MTSTEDVLEEYVEFIEADRYARNMRTMFGKAGPFIEERDVRGVEEISVRDCHVFSKYLRRKVDKSELADSSANTIYS